MPPLSKITGGSLYIWSPSSSSFTLESKDFAILFSLGDLGSFSVPHQASAGGTITPSGNLVGDQTLNMGTVDFGGTAGRQLFFTGDLHFVGVPFVLPQPTSKPYVKVTKFTLTGSISAFQQNVN